MNLKVGDKVRIKENLSACEFGYNRYMEEFAGKKATVIRTFGKGGIELDIDKQVWNWSENVLELIEEEKTVNTKIEEGNKVNESDLKDSEIYEKVEEKKEVENDNVKMKRIDYILNARDNIQAILDETVLDCDICPASCENCNGNCEFHYKKYLNEEIEVDKSKLKDSDVESTVEVTKNTKEENDDVVNHPSHYVDGNIEVMDFIEDKQLNFARGNVIKYVSRAGRKDPNKELEDLQKGFWYLNREIERLEKENEHDR